MPVPALVEVPAVVTEPRVTDRAGVRSVGVPVPVFEAHLGQAGPFLRVVEVLSALCCDDVILHCSDEGLLVQSMDSHHVAMVSTSLRAPAFAVFRCDRPMSLSMSVDSLGKLLAVCGPNDPLKLRWNNNADVLNCQWDSSEEDHFAGRDLHVRQVDSERIELPELQCKVFGRFTSWDLLAFCEGGQELGDALRVSASVNGITFSVPGVEGAGNVMLEPQESEMQEQEVAMTVLEPVSATYALHYLNVFLTAAPRCGAVELGMGPDTLLRVGIGLESEAGSMRLYLAPRVA